MGSTNPRDDTWGELGRLKVELDLGEVGFAALIRKQPHVAHLSHRQVLPAARAKPD
jgi:hypothetical protein